MTAPSVNDRMSASGVQFGTSGIRGLVDAMDDDLCFAFAHAFFSQIAPDARSVVIGHDLRPSSPRIAAACAAAARASGCSVEYAGVLPTPALAWYAQEHAMPAIMVTGSHIPFDRNGIKFYRADGEISKADEARMRAAPVVRPQQAVAQELPPCNPAIVAFYAQRYLGFFPPAALQGMRVGFYEHSSAARDVLGRILQTLGAEVVSLGRTDHFVPIDTEAVSAADRQLARQWAGSLQLDALISTDGDADRPLLADEQGAWLRGDVLGILCAQHLGVDQVVTPVSSLSSVEGCGSFARVLRTRIGSPYVIEGMQSLAGAGHSVAGFEANGGFLLGSLLHREHRPLGALPTRDAALPILVLLCAARAAAQPLSALPAALPRRYSASDRLTEFAPERGRSLIQALQADAAATRSTMAPAAGAVEHTDGLDGWRVRFASGDIVHLRLSGNAPELRCYAEAATQEAAERLCHECLARVQQWPWA